MSPHNKKRLKYYLLTLSAIIVVIGIQPSYSFVEPSPSPTTSPPVCEEGVINIDCLPITNPPIQPSPTPTPTPTPETSQFYDTPTNVEAAIVIMEASKKWGVIIYPAIYAVQIIGIILRYV